jgi:multiple antibiotic resistance protein
MMLDFKEIIATFIPLFVAVDPIGVLPVYVGLTHHLSPGEQRKVLIESIFTATFVALMFIFVGKAIFNFLGITVPDFQIAGGVVLLVLAIMDLLISQKSEGAHLISDSAGVVPIGVPLIVGPAVLTTIMIQVDSYGFLPTLISILINIAIISIVFFQSKWFIKILGESGAKAISKVVSLLLAAIAVMMIRKGIMAFIHLS